MHSELRSLQAAMQAATLAPKKLMDHPWPPGYVTFLQGHTDTVILMREAPVDKDVRVAAVGAEMLMTILPVDDKHSSIIWVLRSSIHLVAWNACFKPAARDMPGAAGQQQWDSTQENQDLGAAQMRINGAMMAGGPPGASSPKEWGNPGHGSLVHHDPGGARMSWCGQDDVRQPDWEPYSFSRSTSRPMEPNSLLSKKGYDGLTSDSWMEVQESA